MADERPRPWLATMAYGVADKKLLSGVKTGDKLKFRVEMVKNAPTVTRIEPAQ